MHWIDTFKKEIPGEHRPGELLSAHTNFRIGGPADVLFVPHDTGALEDALKFLQAENVPALILGGGYNLLVSDEGFRGAVIKLPETISEPLLFDGDTVCASAGLPLKRLVHEAAARGLSGVENLAGIPGAVGGAVYMNAGAYGSCVADVCVSATTVSAHGGVRELNAEQLQFSYRRSVLQEDRSLVAVGAVFHLSAGADPAALEARCREIIKTRNSKHPVGLPSGGSFFKNTRGLPPAGRLIEETGLKGLSVGGAQVSPMHANFIVNTGGATCRHVLDLMALVQEKVQQAHGILLEPEVRIIA
jgi:UDP-N-acetylmuramate dehydrogenase